MARTASVMSAAHPALARDHHRPVLPTFHQGFTIIERDPALLLVPRMTLRAMLPQNWHDLMGEIDRCCGEDGSGENGKKNETHSDVTNAAGWRNLARESSSSTGMARQARGCSASTNRQSPHSNEQCCWRAVWPHNQPHIFQWLSLAKPP